jgi:GGDEF domain-containing protein
MRETPGCYLARAGGEVHGPIEASASTRGQDTIDRMAADVARRFRWGDGRFVAVGDQEGSACTSTPPAAAGRALLAPHVVVRAPGCRGPGADRAPDDAAPGVLEELFRRRTLLRHVGVPVPSRDGSINGALRVRHRAAAADARAVDALCDAAQRLAVELHAGLERLQTLERFTALSRLALTDPVTSLANRRGGEEAFAREVARARRGGSPLSLVLFDIDHFKNINDQAGHAVGDRVLRGISEILSASQRGSDLAMRWGGEEFLVLLPEGLQARVRRARARERAEPPWERPAASPCRPASRNCSPTREAWRRSPAPTRASVRRPRAATASSATT